MSTENNNDSGEETPVYASKPGVPRETAQRTVSIYRMFDTKPEGFATDPMDIALGFYDAPGFHISGDRVIGPIDKNGKKDKKDQPIGQAWQPDYAAPSPCCGTNMEIIGPKKYRCPACGAVYNEN